MGPYFYVYRKYSNCYLPRASCVRSKTYFDLKLTFSLWPFKLNLYVVFLYVWILTPTRNWNSQRHQRDHRKLDLSVYNKWYSCTHCNCSNNKICQCFIDLEAIEFEVEGGKAGAVNRWALFKLTGTTYYRYKFGTLQTKLKLKAFLKSFFSMRWWKVLKHSKIKNQLIKYRLPHRCLVWYILPVLASVRTSCWFLNLQNGVLFYRQPELLKFTDSVIGPICWLNHLVNQGIQSEMRKSISVFDCIASNRGKKEYSNIQKYSAVWKYFHAFCQFAERNRKRINFGRSPNLFFDEFCGRSKIYRDKFRFSECDLRHIKPQSHKKDFTKKIELQIVELLRKKGILTKKKWNFDRNMTQMNFNVIFFKGNVLRKGALWMEF